MINNFYLDKQCRLFTLVSNVYSIYRNLSIRRYSSCLNLLLPDTKQSICVIAKSCLPTLSKRFYPGGNPKLPGTPLPKAGEPSNLAKSTDNRSPTEDSGNFFPNNLPLSAILKESSNDMSSSTYMNKTSIPKDQPTFHKEMLDKPITPLKDKFIPPASQQSSTSKIAHNTETSVEYNKLRQIAMETPNKVSSSESLSVSSNPSTSFIPKPPPLPSTQIKMSQSTSEPLNNTTLLQAKVGLDDVTGAINYKLADKQIDNPKKSQYVVPVIPPQKIQADQYDVDLRATDFYINDNTKPTLEVIEQETTLFKAIPYNSKGYTDEDLLELYTFVTKENNLAITTDEKDDDTNSK